MHQPHHILLGSNNAIELPWLLVSQPGIQCSHLFSFLDCQLV